MQDYFIYALVEPEHKLITYVGVTIHPEARLKAHHYNGLKGEMCILETISDENDWKARIAEARWIRQLYEEGYPLANIAGLEKIKSEEYVAQLKREMN